jgi:hypothetical protein
VLDAYFSGPGFDRLRIGRLRALGNDATKPDQAARRKLSDGAIAAIDDVFVVTVAQSFSCRESRYRHQILKMEIFFQCSLFFFFVESMGTPSDQLRFTSPSI